ncbi:MAG: hypothetical protein ACTSYB_10645 [Candidatus Helarchaeota archaeon]
MRRVRGLDATNKRSPRINLAGDMLLDRHRRDEACLFSGKIADRSRWQPRLRD